MPNETRPGDPSGRDSSRRQDQSAPLPNVQEMVLVQFKGHRKSYYHNRLNVQLAAGEYCLVEADRFLVSNGYLQEEPRVEIK